MQLTTLAAFLFPIPLTILMIKDHSIFNQLYRMNLLFGSLLFLPIILGIISSMLIYLERDNDTLKNLLTIPISKNRLILAKLTVVLFLSEVYSFGSLVALFIANILMKTTVNMGFFLAINLIVGLAVFIGIIPVIIIIILLNGSYVPAIIISIVYAIVSLVVTLMIGSVNEASLQLLSSILPIPIILRWCIGVLPLEINLPEALHSTQISSMNFAFIMIVYLIVLTYLAVYFYRKSKN